MTTPAAVPPRKGWYRSLYMQVLVGALLGAGVGLAAPTFGAALEPLGQAFIKLVRMIIDPLVFCTLVVGIAGSRGEAAMGRIGGKALLYFEVMSTLALFIGLAVGLLVQPGAGFQVDPRTIDMAEVAPYVDKGAQHTVSGFLLGIIPDTLVGAFTSGDMVQVLFVSLLTAFALLRLGPAGEPLLRAMEKLEGFIFAFARLVMLSAPLGAFGAMAFVVGKFGWHAIGSLLLLIGTLYLAEIAFVVLVLGTVARLCGFSIFKLLRYIKDEILLVIGTSCAESALPGLIPKLEQAGARPAVVRLVVPGGYAFNSDGTNIYLTLAILFIAQATGTHLSFGQLAGLLAVAMLTSKGAGGVSGSSFIALAATLSVVPDLPLAGIALILGIDRFLSEARSTTNMIGNAVATLVVAKWEGALDMERLRAALDGERRAAAQSAGVTPA